MLSFILPKERHHVLVVDDEPDVHRVTQLTLKSLKINGNPLKILTAETGMSAVQLVKEHPETAVVLLDVVMETDDAGLKACRAIRQFNPFVRIVLRTGQPGQAPERETIAEYDINDYLPKADLTTNRLYTSVRTAVRAWQQLIELDRYAQYLKAINESVATLHAFDPLEKTLQSIIDTVMLICPCELAILRLETFAMHGEPKNILMHSSNRLPRQEAIQTAALLDADIIHDDERPEQARPYKDGFLMPVALPQDLGEGWIFVKDADLDPIRRLVLPLISAHAANALYNSIAQALLKDDEAFFEGVIIY